MRKNSERVSAILEILSEPLGHKGFVYRRTRRSFERSDGDCFQAITLVTGDLTCSYIEVEASVGFTSIEREISRFTSLPASNLKRPSQFGGTTSHEPPAGEHGHWSLSFLTDKSDKDVAEEILDEIHQYAFPMLDRFANLEDAARELRSDESRIATNPFDRIANFLREGWYDDAIRIAREQLGQYEYERSQRQTPGVMRLCMEWRMIKVRLEQIKADSIV